MKQKSKALMITMILLRVVVIIAIIMVLVMAGKKSYSFGYRIFAEDTVSDPPGKKIAVTINDGIEASELAKLLKSKGLIRDEKVFQVQYQLSQYKGKLKSGSYILNTSQTSEEMLEVLSAADETESESE